MDVQSPEYRVIQGAWVHGEARLPEDLGDVHLEPGAFIGAHVELGRGTWVGSGAVIYGPTKLGEKNQVHPHAVLGGAPQDLSYAGQPTRLEIGDRNIFREGVTINRASTKSAQVTRIGSDNLFMANVHIGHDCQIENRIILANSVMLAGHCQVQSNVNLAGACAVAQFCTVGRFAFVCGTSGVRKDLEPFISHDIRSKTYGETQPACINEVGLRRAGISPETIEKLRSAYKVLYLRNGVEDLIAARNEIESRGCWCSETEELLAFIERKRKTRFGRSLSG